MINCSISQMLSNILAWPFINTLLPNTTNGFENQTRFDRNVNFKLQLRVSSLLE